MSENGNGTNKGTVEQVIGVVIDAVFPDKLPEIYTRKIVGSVRCV